jgi:7-cyano-7-deazaguanine synthase
MHVDARRELGIPVSERVAALVSGGLDSAVLLASLAQTGPVVPIYVSCGLAWEQAERDAVDEVRRLFTEGSVMPLVEFSMPLADLYGGHWSVHGRGVPDARTDDAAVELLGRNAVLAIKPLLWCAREGISCLAIATLAGNPFADASLPFFRTLAGLVSTSAGADVVLASPFRGIVKSDLVRSADAGVLAASMSCLAPVKHADGWWHCGACNKCAERQRGFRDAGVQDPTRYQRQSLPTVS